MSNQLADGIRPVKSEMWRRFGLYAGLLHMHLPERLAWFVARRWPAPLLPQVQRHK